METEYFYSNIRVYINNYSKDSKVNVLEITDDIIQAAYDDLSSDKRKKIIKLKFDTPIVPSNKLLSEHLEISDSAISQKIRMFAYKVINYSEMNKLSDFRELNELSVKTRNSLHRAGIFTIEDLRNTPEEKLLRTRNIGSKSIDEIKDLCKKHGFAI